MIEITNEKIIEQASETVNDAIYKVTEPMLHELLKAFPENKEPYQIAAKVLMLDKLYATQIFNYKKLEFLGEIVKNIRTIENFDERVKNGDPTVVPLIYRGFKTRMFSFATKYCCLHNSVVYGKDDYSIYDSSVRKYLPKYAKSIGVKLTGTQLDDWYKAGDYKAFNDAVDEVLDKAEITVENRKRNFDLFLWSQR